MKASALICLGVLLVLSVMRAAAQGSLTPSGPPAPTFKTLHQVQPRTPISSLPYTINSSGSYYLTASLSVGAGTNGITVQADNVTLDLSGFALTGSGGTAAGVIVSSAQKNLAVHNGTVANWGLGINATNAANSQFERLRLSNNAGHGLSTGSNCWILACSAQSNGGGINAGAGNLIKDSIASHNTTNGIVTSHSTIVTDCVMRGNGRTGIIADFSNIISGCEVNENGLYGIYAESRSVIKNCAVRQNVNNGISVSNGSLVSDCVSSINAFGFNIGGDSIVTRCVADFNASSGIRVYGSDSLVLDNSCMNNGTSATDGAGIVIDAAANRIQGNNLNSNDRGLVVNVLGNLILGNSARGNTTNFVISAGNRYGPIINITPAGSPSVTGNAAVSTVASTDPWANFAY